MEDNGCRSTLRTLLRSGSSNGREDVRKWALAELPKLAAGPDLYNALGTLLMRIDAGGQPFPEDWERARAAITLANRNQVR